MIFNTQSSPRELKKDFPVFKIGAVNATEIALNRLGVPITNTVMLGALVKTTGIVDIKNIEYAVLERFNVKNVEAVKEAFDKTIVLEG